MDIPKILLNPNKYDFSIDDQEVYYLLDAKRDLIKRNYRYVFQSVWNAVINNLKRRIEEYGANHFLQNLEEEEKNRYFRSNDSVSKKLNLLNNLVLIKNCLKLKIINEKTYTVLNFFYWFSKSSNDSLLIKDELLSIIHLLEINLFSLDIRYKAKTFNKPTHLKNENKERKDIENEEVLEEKNDKHINKRKTDLIKTRIKTKKLKKEDLLFMHHFSIPKRRKDDWINNTPKRRKDDRVEPLPKRRKTDFIEETPKRRKDDIKEQTPRRRKDD